MSRLEIEHLRFCYVKNSPPVLSDFSMFAEDDTIVAVVGNSGCGKTTLLRLIAGLEKPTEGIIRIAGSVAASADIFVEPEKRGVGMVFQDYALFPHMTVQQNIAYALHGVEKSKRHERIKEFLTLVDLTAHKNKYPFELSGGQQQRVALARSLSQKPKLLLLDEPFSNLDANLRKRIRADVKSILKQSSILTLFVTHDQEDAAFLADKTICL